MKIFRLILILALGLQVGFGADDNGSSGNGQNVGNTNDEEHKYYLKYQSKSIVNEGECQKCDDVKDGFVAIQYHYDDMTGTTYCNVFRETDLNNPVGFAHRQVKSCAFINSKEFKESQKEVQEISNIAKNNKTITSSISNNNKVASNEINFSKFVAGLVTLNPSIINRTSNLSGQNISNIKIANNTYTSLTNNPEQITKNILAGKNSSLDNVHQDLSGYKELLLIGKQGIALSTESISTVDAFNKVNMAYFIDLFNSMEKVYQHLQIFIFVLIGGFFVMQIGASKLQAYLENRGESEGKQPYLHKFYIPLLMIGIFFMPIPEGNGYHSTVMQNMIRYFAQYSTTIADMAHSIGAKVYIEKQYKDMGRFSKEEMDTLTAFKAQKKFTAKNMQKYLNGCGVCVNSMQIDTTKFGTNYHYDNNTKAIKNCDICQSHLNNYAYIVEEWKELDMLYAKSKNYQQNYSTALQDIDKYFVLRNNELGWIDVLLTPTSGLLIETKLLSRVAKDNAESKLSREEQAEQLLKNSQTLRLAKAKNVSKEETKKIEKDNITNSKLGYLAGKLVWMMFPGATAIKDFIEGIGDKILIILGPFILMYFGFVGAIGLFVGSLLNTVSAYAATIVLMEWTFAMIPLLAISVSSLIAYISYLVSLCKYFYISPFVTAWAMATKKTDKIIDFLLAGIAIFFKPVLIVLFIYLALFMHTFINDFFIFVAVEQFSGIPMSSESSVNIASNFAKNYLDSPNMFVGLFKGAIGVAQDSKQLVLDYADDFHTNFIIGAIGGLLKIFGRLASSYIAWRLIVGGPNWALGLIGLDGKQDDMIAQGLENKLASRAFVA